MFLFLRRILPKYSNCNFQFAKLAINIGKLGKIRENMLIILKLSSGGATTMDTTLPIITQSVGQRYVALSIYHGFLTDFTVPFLVTMWCMFAA